MKRESLRAGPLQGQGCAEGKVRSIVAPRTLRLPTYARRSRLRRGGFGGQVGGQGLREGQPHLLPFREYLPNEERIPARWPPLGAGVRGGERRITGTFWLFCQVFHPISIIKNKDDSVVSTLRFGFEIQQTNGRPFHVLWRIP
jgi:hypothetical protein